MRIRQAGAAREDLQLAEWFAGSAPGPGEDDVFDRLRSPDPDRHIEFASWDTPEECQRLVRETLQRELKLAGPDDARGFDLSLGATEYQGYTDFNRTDGDRGVRDAADRWQILSPVRGIPHGVTALNRLIHQRFRRARVQDIRKAAPWQRRFMRPLGPEESCTGTR